MSSRSQFVARLSELLEKARGLEHESRALDTMLHTEPEEEDEEKAQPAAAPQKPAARGGAAANAGGRPGQQGSRGGAGTGAAAASTVKKATGGPSAASARPAASGMNGYADGADGAALPPPPPDPLLLKLVSLRQRLLLHRDEMDAAYRRCFADAECTKPIDAKIGVVGLEKAGKSTFLSGWATKGEAYRLLPSTTAACTGTSVQLYSDPASTDFRANVDFYTPREFCEQLVALCSVLDRLAQLNMDADSMPVTGPLIDSVRRREQLPYDVDAAEVVREVYWHVERRPQWRDLVAQALRPRTDTNRLLELVLLLDRLLKAHAQYGEFLGRQLPLGPTVSAELGALLWPYVSISRERDVQASQFTLNPQPLLVKVVSISGPLPGLPDKIQINDLPGLDSEHQELNTRTADAYKDMDLLVYVKNCLTHPQLWPSEIKLLDSIKQDVDPQMERVLALMNCFNADLSQGVGQAVNTLVAAQEINSRALKEPSRVLFGYANRGDTNRFEQERVDEVYRLIRNAGFVPDAESYNGYVRFTAQLKEVMSRLPSRDAARSERWSAEQKQLIADIDALSLEVQARGGKLSEKEGLFVELFGGSRNLTGLFPTMLTDVSLVRDNCVPSHTSDILPNNDTLFYFQPDLFSPRDDTSALAVFLARTRREKGEEDASKLLARSTSDEATLAQYENAFKPTDDWEPTLPRSAHSQQAIKQRLRTVVSREAGAAPAARTGGADGDATVRSTNQIAEDEAYLERIRQQLTEDQKAELQRGQLRNKLDEWLTDQRGQAPLSFSLVEGQYRRLVRNKFADLIKWIAVIDRANILSTLDHLTDVVLLSAVNDAPEFGGCLLNLFVDDPAAASDGPSKATAAAAAAAATAAGNKPELRFRAELRELLVELKMRVFAEATLRLQEVANEALRLLLGVQPARQEGHPTVSVTDELRRSPVLLELHLRNAQRTSFVQLIMEPCGEPDYVEHSTCRHSGWTDFPWPQFNAALLHNHRALLTNRRLLCYKLSTGAAQARNAIKQLEASTEKAAGELFHSISDKEALEVSAIVPKFMSGYHAVSVNSLPTAPPFQLEQRMPVADMSLADLKDELKRLVPVIAGLNYQWTSVYAQWQDTYSRFTAVEAWLDHKRAAALFGGSYATAQKTMEASAQAAKSSARHMEEVSGPMSQLVLEGEQLQRAIALSERQPGQQRRQFLERLFCMPLQFTADDLKQVKEAEAVLGEAPCPQLTVGDSLLRKSSRFFVEAADFTAYEDSTTEAGLLYDNFPPRQGKELAVLHRVVHLRTMRALEHVTQLICYNFKRDNVLYHARQLVCDLYLTALRNAHTPLYALASVSRAAIWPLVFLGGQGVNFSVLEQIMKRISDVAHRTEKTQSIR